MLEKLMLPVILLPMAGGILLKALKIKDRRTVRLFTGAVTLLTSMLTWLLILHAGDAIVVLLQFTWDFTLKLRFDALGRFFAGIVATLWPLTVCYAYEYLEDDDRQDTFFMWFCIAYGVTLGVAMAGNMFTLYIFYEMLTLSTVPLVMHTGTPDAVRAARTYFNFSLGGAACALISILYLIAGDPLSHTLTLTRIFYVIGAAGFSVKAAMFPMDAWLPKASVAPTPVTALLHAVAVVMAGAFAVLRLTWYGYNIYVIHETWAQYLMMGLAAFTIVYGSAKAVKELHFKRRLAYSTVSNLSYILFGIFLMTEQGLVGALLHMAFHAEIKIVGFFAAGAVLHHTGREYVYELDGLGHRMKWTSACFTVIAVALTGIPPLSGFISKWYLLTAAGTAGTALSYIGAAALLISALLTAIYMFTVIRRLYFPEKSAVEAGAVSEAGIYMLLPMILITAGVILTGLFPGAAIRAAEAVAATAGRIGGEF